MKRIGLDPGYGNFKAACVDDDERIAVVPSVVGVGKTDIGALTLGALGKRQRVLPRHVEFGGVTYLVGDNVAEHTTPRQRMDAERLSDTPDLRALTFATLHALLGPGEHETSIITGFPVHVLEDRAEAGRVLRGLRSWLAGTHQFTVNDEAVTLTIPDGEAVQGMPQPSGAFFAWGMDNRGGWKQDGRYKDAPIAICDIGFNTLDLFTVQAGRVSNRYTEGATLGVRRAAETLIGQVEDRGGETLDLGIADALLRAEKPICWIEGEEVDLRPLVQQAIASATAGILSLIERKWGEGRGFGLILFTGGGASLLAGELRRQYPRGIVLPDPVAANALGLARYAQRAFR